jgi:phage shock protein A
MFDDLRAAFREALDNFNKELRRDHVSETADRLLVGMKNEIADEKVQVSTLQSQLEKTLGDSSRVSELAATCRRRERMARDIGDEETATVAAQHAIKHEGHQAVLERKAQAIREELEFRRRNVDEMITKFTEAKQQRDALSATAGRSEARDSFAEADDLFSELDRMAEKIEGERRTVDASEALDDLDSGEDEFDYDVSVDTQQEKELEVDAALAELKRRMGRS